MSVLCVPMHVQGFVLNDLVADDNQVKIAPITQPNYTFLRFNENIPAADVLDNVDLHYTAPAVNNSRVTDLGSGASRTNRKGVYLSWTIPRFYRSGTSASANTATTVGNLTTTPDTADSTVPVFRTVPTRWLVVRHIDTSTVDKAITDPNVLRQLQCTAWVIESNRQFTLADLDALDDANKAKATKAKTNSWVAIDLQVDVSPYISQAADGNNDDSAIQKQSEVFLGLKTLLADWTPDVDGEKDGKPRVKPLSLLNSSNPLFADFQHHNSNCFSMLDNFAYINSSGTLQYLSSATASYYVVGWHPDASEDPLYVKDTAANRESSLKITFNGDMDTQLAASSTTVTHGALYDVQWTLNAAPSRTAAQQSAASLAAPTPNEPVSIGTTAIDALLAYVAAHKATDTGDLQQLEKDIWNLRQLLIAQNDSVDALLEAHDMLYDYGFSRSDGGGQWYLSGSSDDTLALDGKHTTMATLNAQQLALDNATRTLKQLQSQLFSIWWRFVTGAVTDSNSVKNTELPPLLARIKTIFMGSSALATTKTPDANTVLALMQSVQSLAATNGLGVEKGTLPSYNLAKDPTMVIGGIKAGWPTDYLDNLLCRMDNQISQSSTSLPGSWNQFSSLVTMVASKLPSGISTTVSKLLSEFAQLQNPASTVSLPPLYHDQGPANIPVTNPQSPMRDRWNGQPWFPLFVEWVAEYYHIPFSSWDLESALTFGSSSNDPLLQYGIKPGVTLTDGYDPKTVDVRIIKGRSLLLPQPGFSLQNSIDQLLQKLTDDDLKALDLDPSQRDFLKHQTSTLPFLSLPMSGLRENLLTRLSGAHIKPTQRSPGLTPNVVAAAADPSGALASVGLNADALLTMGLETALVPYGRGIENVAALSWDQNPLFKPVTHGQLRFTQVNVIDKFGQAICAIDPSPAVKGQHVAPALGENYKVQALSTDSSTPNVRIRDVAAPNNEFVQLRPSINQPARLNGTPVVLDSPPQDVTGKPRWRPALDWEDPVYGWVINNYEDNSIQIFLHDGTFYSELTLGGRSGDVQSPAWLPFQEPPNTTVPDQLKQLVNQLEDRTYLEAFVNMLNWSTNDLPPAPTSYAQYMNAIISKPLALVNLGWSLELSTPPLHNESTQNRMEPDMTLLPVNAPELPCGRDASQPPVYPANQTQYSFPIKLGDATRTYDGLIGYFLPPTTTTPTLTSPFDLSTLYTYWPTPSSPTKPITRAQYPTLNAFHASPDKPVNPTNLLGGTIMKTPDELASERNSHLNVITAIIDPFTAVHAYSGILPVTPTTIPSWVVQKALKKMTAFFRMGPLLVPGATQIPNFDAKGEVSTSDPPSKTYPGYAVPIPAVGLGQWQWLQPYDESTTDSPAPQYMGLTLKKTDVLARYEDGPYLAVEGYLRLAAPLSTTDTSNAGPMTGGGGGSISNVKVTA